MIDLTEGWIKLNHGSIHGKIRYCSLCHNDKISSGALPASWPYLKSTGQADYFHSDGAVIDQI